jgi:hypothetical protein
MLENLEERLRVKTIGIRYIPIVTIKTNGANIYRITQRVLLLSKVCIKYQFPIEFRCSF